MLHSFFSPSRPLVFAHRGGAGLAPENTLAAFDHGLALGADGLELDVHLSRDGVVVVHHDRTLARTTDLEGAVAERTAAELSAADAGFRYRRADGGFPFRGRGIGVPTLEDVLIRYAKIPIIIELKVNTGELARAVVDLVRKVGAVDRVCLGSFSLGVLRAARRFDPAIATSASREETRWALYRSRLRWPMRLPPYGGFQVPEWSGTTRVVSPRFIDVAHRARLGVQVWTVDTEIDAERLLGWGVDALITDRPDIIVPVCKRRL